MDSAVTGTKPMILIFTKKLKRKLVWMERFLQELIKPEELESITILVSGII